MSSGKGTATCCPLVSSKENSLAPSLLFLFWNCCYNFIGMHHQQDYYTDE